MLFSTKDLVTFGTNQLLFFLIFFGLFSCLAISRFNSGALYLIYILDLPYITHQEIHDPKEYNECKRPNIKTFIDDCLIKVTKKEDSNLSEEVAELMTKVEEYAAANLLVVNPDKTKVVIVSKDEQVKKDFTIKLNGEVIKHSTEVKVLGIKISDSLMWDRHVEKVLIPQIRNRIRIFRQVAKYMGSKFRRMYANVIYRSKNAIWDRILGRRSEDFNVKVTKSTGYNVEINAR